MTATFGPFLLDSDGRQLTHRAQGAVHLTPKALDLLILLVAEAPRVIRKSELHECLWPETFVSDATLVSLIKELRRALGDRQASSPLIRTAHGVGYALAGSVERVSPSRPSVTSRWIVAGARRIALNDGENLIGRDRASTVWLDVAGVSRRHARILVGPDDAVLEDLGSKNGTMLNDKAVTEKVRLRDGDPIQVGPALIVYHASASGMSTETVSTLIRDR